MRVKLKKAPHKGAFFVWAYLLVVAGGLSSTTLWAADCVTRHIDEYAMVDYVYDGDTVRLEDGRKVRIIGIDAPEMVKAGRVAAPYANEARRALIQMLGDERRIGLVFDKVRRDKYQRWLAYVYNASGEDVSTLMLRRGLAAMMIVPPNTRFVTCYYKEEKEARHSAAGIWALPAHRVTSALDLSNRKLGYRVVSGKVVTVSVNTHSIWLLLDNKLTVRIQKTDLEYFAGISFIDLQGKKLIVRGRIFKSNRGLIMPLRHSSAMELVS